MSKVYHLDSLIAIVIIALSTGCISSPVWHVHNDGLPTGAPLLALAADPTSPQTLLAGTYDEHGLYRSEDGGATWAPVAHGLPPRPVHALLRPSTHPGVVLAGTGDGLYRSTDGGTTWRYLLADPAQLPFAIYAFSEEPGGSIYLGGDQNALWRSDDGGATWVALPPIAGEISVLSLAYNPASALLLAGSDRNGVYFSADRGESWQRGDRMDRTAIAGLLVLEAAGGRMVLARGRQGLWRSSDGGRTWEPVRVTARGRIDALALVGDQPYFLTNEGNLYRSNDQGQTWTPHGTGLGRSGTAYFLQAMSGDAATIFAGTEHRLYRSHDAGQSWQPASTGLGAPDAARLAIGAGGALLLANGDGLFWTTDWSTPWQPVEGLPAGAVYTVAASRHDSERVYAATQRAGLWRSDDGGLSWRPTGLPHGAPGMVIHPDNPERVFAHVIYERVYESRDGAQRWEPRWEGMNLSTEVISLVIDPCRPDRLFAGTTATLYQSDDGAATWQSIAPALDGQTVFTVLTDCGDPNSLLTGATNGLYRSSDGGLTWTAMAGLEQTTVTAIARDPRQPGRLWAGTKYRGLYQSSDNGASWSPAGLEGASVHQLVSAPDGGWIAATSTQGVWYAILEP